MGKWTVLWSMRSENIEVCFVVSGIGAVFFAVCSVSRPQSCRREILVRDRVQNTNCRMFRTFFGQRTSVMNANAI